MQISHGLVTISSKSKSVVRNTSRAPEIFPDLCVSMGKTGSSINKYWLKISHFYADAPVNHPGLYSIWLWRQFPCALLTVDISLTFSAPSEIALNNLSSASYFSSNRTIF